MNPVELYESNEYYVHHESLCRGYVSRKLDLADCPCEPYSGIFGEGYTVLLPNYDSSRYVKKVYFLRRPG